MKDGYRGFMTTVPDRPVPLSQSDATLFIGCCMADNGSSESVDKLYDQCMRSPALRIIRNRLDTLNLPVNKSVQLFLAAICETPGDAAMWVYTLNQIAVETKCLAVDMFALSRAFPIGFPSKDARDVCWDAQKDADSPLGNLIDNPKAYPGAAERNPDLPEAFNMIDIWGEHEAEMAG